ncbi:autotransporter secretion inner membrane protein TamB [Loktanella fryxellensis]|uniref:Autotransporter secretion inner membrane protein TamB n=1 Tax=Loktanella fryxellensis TaxID=245187 RepID=A0A1H8AHT3_9RHOB|nr:translocation/assembly module TamB domain-containing protein [Loktanella fryxellensis]SEM70181.1 autotransporter secretion inner membrane protein TamB [Loktanella fryxellensis]
MRYFLCLLVLLTLPFALLAQDEPAPDDDGEGYLTRLLQDNLTGDDRIVDIVGFQGALSSRASVERITVADSEGVWLELNDMVLDWNRAALLRGRIDVQELTAALIRVERAPVPGADLPSPEAQPFSLPNLPVGINLDTLNVARIELGESFLGEPVALTVAGTAMLAGGEGSANVTANRLDGQSGLFVIDGAYDNDTGVLGLTLNVEEAEDGIAARLLNLPDRPSVRLTIAGEAPISEYAADITLATGGQDRISGDFALNTIDGQTGFALNIGGDLTPLLAADYADFFGPDVTLVAAGSAGSGGFALTTLDLSAQSIALNGQVLIGPNGWPERIALTGNVRDAGGAPVLLPIGGPKTYVDNVALALNYDQSAGDDWTADFDITNFDRPGLGIAAITLGGGGVIEDGNGPATGRFTADLDYAATGVALDDAGAAQAFGDTLEGRLSLTRVENAPTEVTAFTLTGPGVELNAQATIAGPTDGFMTQADVTVAAEAIERFSTLVGRNLGGAAQAELTVTATPLDGLFDIGLDATTQDLAVDIPQLDPVLTGTGTVVLRAVRDTAGTRLEDLTITTPEATVTADADITSVDSDARFAVTVRNVALIAPGVEGPASITGTATRNATGNIVFDVDGTAPATTLTATGAVDPAEGGQTANATVTAAVTDLSVYSQVSGQDLSGAADVTVNATLLSDMTRFTAQIDAATTDLQTGLAQIDPLLTGAGTIRGEVGLIGTDRYLVRNLVVQTPELSLTADADGGLTGPLSVDADLRVSEIGLIADGLTGPLAVTLDATRDDAGLTQATLRADGPGTAIAADVAVAAPTEKYRITGNIDAAVADLAPYAALAGQDIAGGIDMAVQGSLLPDLSLFDVTLDGTTRDLATGIAQADALLAGDGRVRASVARTGPDAFALTDLNVATPQLMLQGDAAGGLTGPLDADIRGRLDNAGALAQGLDGPVDIALTASRDATGTAQVDLTAQGVATDVTLDAEVASQEDDYRITGTLDAVLGDLSQFATLAGLPLSGGVTVQADGTLLPDLSQLDAQVNASTSDLGIGNATVDQLLAGQGRIALDAAKAGADITMRSFDVAFPQVSASGNLTAGDGGAASGTVVARLADIGLFTDALSGPVTAQGDVGRTAAGGYTLDIDATGPGGISATAQGAVGADGTLDLDINGNAPLGLANPFLDPRRLEGVADFAIAANGPPALSSVTGTISTTGARLADPGLAQALEGIDATIKLNGGQAQVALTGDVQSGGSIAINGPVTLASPFDGSLTLDVNAVELRDPNLYETVVNGQITVSGPLAGGAAIAGQLALGETNVRVPSSGIGALGELPDVTHINPSPEVVQTLNRAEVAVDGGAAAAAEASGGGGPAYPLNVTVNAPNRIFIRGRGVDAELGGSLQLGGTTANIVPVGQFDLQRGRISILQQRFDLTEGSASLQGDFIPYIRLVATTQADTGTTINIVVEGPANDPEVTFQSVPDLPQDEVLSQLIFGRDISEISPLQAVQLAAAVGELAGRGGGGLIEGFRSGIGLDDFDVTTDAEGNAAVRAGKYLSDNLYTDVTIGSDGSTEINLNLDITDEITAKGTAGADGDTSIGVFFERDY